MLTAQCTLYLVYKICAAMRNGRYAKQGINRIDSNAVYNAKIVYVTKALGNTALA